MTFWRPKVCTGEGPPCTELLNNPASVLLGDPTRRPTHVCHDPFLRESTEQWARRAIIRASTEINAIAVEEWFGWWPLPIGREAVDRVRSELSLGYLIPGYNTLLNAVPFEGDQEALWALRIERDGAVLDLFGLAAYADKEDLYRKHANITKCTVVHVMRGRDTDPLISLVKHAQDWWSTFSRDRRVGGRPRNSGTWASAEEFEESLRAVVRMLHQQGARVTQETVAEYLNRRPGSPSGGQARQLRKWLKDFGIDWKDVRELR